MATFATSDDDLHRFLLILMRLSELATSPSTEMAPLDLDQGLNYLAPDLIPGVVEIPYRTQVAQQGGAPPDTALTRRRTGRNAPCPAAPERSSNTAA